jgi:hypothetical protein
MSATPATRRARLPRLCEERQGYCIWHAGAARSPRPAQRGEGTTRPVLHAECDSLAEAR